MAAALALVAVGVVATHEDDGEVEVRATVPESPRVTSVAAALRPAPHEEGILEPSVAGLPSEGITVKDGDAVLLLDVSGNVLHRLDGFDLWQGTNLRGPSGTYAIDSAAGTLRRTSDHVIPLAYDGRLVVGEQVPTAFVERDGHVVFNLGARSYGISYDADIVTLLSDEQPRAYDLRTDTTRTLPAQCEVADRHGRAWFLTCYDSETSESSIRRLRADGRTTVVTGQLEHGGWEGVLVSPDGLRFLGLASHDCGAPPQVLIGSTTSGRVRELRSWIGVDGEPDVEALGWTAAGEAVFTLGSADGGSGVFAFDGTTLRTLHVTADPWPRAAMWLPPPRPTAT